MFILRFRDSDMGTVAITCHNHLYCLQAGLGSDLSIRYVTVRQLLEATQTHSTSPFKIDGNEFNLKKVTKLPLLMTWY
jgi:hypothetical protein